MTRASADEQNEGTVLNAIELLGGSLADVAGFAAYIDYRDHVRLSDDEIRAALDRLTASGELVRLGGAWWLPDKL